MNNIILSIVALALVFGGFTLLSSGKGQTSNQQASIIGALESEEEVKETEEVMEKENDSEVMEKEENEKMERKDSEVMSKEETVMEKKEEVMTKEEEVQVQSDSAMEKQAGEYSVYSETKLAQAKGDIILFFHAAWCPSCRTLDSDIQASLNDIPDGVTILRLDYDSETELKKKYGVRSQHTMVQVDSTGNKIQSWAGGNSLESLLSKI